MYLSPFTLGLFSVICSLCGRSYFYREMLKKRWEAYQGIEWLVVLRYLALKDCAKCETSKLVFKY